MDKNVLEKYSSRIEELTSEIVEPITKLVGISVCLGIIEGEQGEDKSSPFDINKENVISLYNQVYQYIYETLGSAQANAVRDGIKGRFETLLGIKL